QADVGVAMNTGTSAAKEAGNMVDLDSNPTKLILTTKSVGGLKVVEFRQCTESRRDADLR
ncbi:hypothetical protein, partial [Streptomyces sp. NPDC005970]|uniref:hypothetical protein n=1 Tax=Streptomyces sp. NPDC005970 TaxID=3156723 RepID=UPI0033F49FC9